MQLVGFYQKYQNKLHTNQALHPTKNRDAVFVG